MRRSSSSRRSSRARCRSSRMTQIPQRDLREVAGMNAFFIIPTSVKKAGAELFMTHPPLEKRLARLGDIAREMGRPVEL